MGRSLPFLAPLLRFSAPRLSAPFPPETPVPPQIGRFLGRTLAPALPLVVVALPLAVCKLHVLFRPLRTVRLDAAISAVRAVAETTYGAPFDAIDGSVVRDS